ncbi:MAG: hypothetical protein AAF438_02765 [Pseudomonadota bacterium]
MATDFTVIQGVRQQFGAADETQGGEASAPFVGPSKEFPFETARVDRNQHAILQFQSFGVQHRRNILRVNGTDVFGGLTTSIELLRETELIVVRLNQWQTHSLLINPGVLREQNTLFIESRDSDGDTSGRLDSFVLDNITILFKTREQATNPGDVFV